MPATITYDQLKALGACREQLMKFRRVFGDSVDVTEELAAKYAQEFDFDWASSNLLRAAAKEEYSNAAKPALEEYRRAIVPAEEEYDRAVAPALGRCGCSIKLTWDGRIRATTLAWEEYLRATAPAREEYRRAIAVAFAKCYIDYIKQCSEEV
jgi:hypothetical protein